MKERPILFSAPMVRALLDGSKTQTRRVVKPQPPADKQRSAWYEPGIMGWAPPEIPSQHWHRVRCPYGQPGDRLWVRERWAAHWMYNDVAPVVARSHREDLRSGDNRWFAADGDSGASQLGHPPDGLRGRWRPSIHMPRWASRITREVTGVRVERLQDISEADAKAEGVVWEQGQTATNVFETLWESINGPGSWEANPWVWVISFKREQSA